MGESFPDLGGITGAAHGAIGTSAAIAAGELAKGANQFTGIDAGFDGIGTAGNRDSALAAEHAAQGDDGIGIVAARFIDHQAQRIGLHFAHCAGDDTQSLDGDGIP